MLRHQGREDWGVRDTVGLMLAVYESAGKKIPVEIGMPKEAPQKRMESIGGKK